MESIFTVASGLKPRRAMIVTLCSRRRSMAGRWRKVAVKFVAGLYAKRDGWQLYRCYLPEALTPDLDWPVSAYAQ